MTAFGYIKDIQALFPVDNSYYNIHDLIKQICTLYYACIHEWDAEHIGHKIKLNKTTNSIKQIKDLTSSSSYLKEAFSSGMHHWRFKIDVCKQSDLWSTTLGIWKTRFGEPPPNICFSLTKDDCCYGFAYSLGELLEGDGCPAETQYGVMVKSVDVVEMHCDMDKLELSYIINGVDYGVAYRDIEQTEYRVAANLYNIGDTVTILP